LNDEHFEDTLNYSISSLGFESTVLDVVFPFLQRIGIMWQTGAINPAQEHFISNLVRQKILSAIDHLPHLNYNDKEKYLLFLPDGELHEIGLLFNYYLLKKRGYKVIYLGQSVPFDDLISVYSVHQPKYLVSIFTFSFEMISVTDYIDKLSSVFSESTIYLSGFQLSDFQNEIPSNVKFYKSSSEFIKMIDKI
jgi:methanogenic corrinoid protein MtbC1